MGRTNRTAPLPTSEHAGLTGFVRERAVGHGVPGVAVGVLFGDRGHVAYHGVTSTRDPRPVDARTLFQIGATGKTLTATLLMCLAETGEVDLGAPVREYLPDFRVRDPSVSTRVTVLHLLNHTAGWNGEFDLDTGRGDDALAAFVAAMADLEQTGPLGGTASYNNAAFSVAGRVVEVVTGLTYEDAVKRRLLDPLGMTETYSPPLPDDVGHRLAAGHVKTSGRVEVAGAWTPPRCLGPAGDLCSTAADQLRYARFHLGDGRAPGGGRLLSPEGLRRMRRPTASTVSGGRVGISWFLRDAGGVGFAFHGGSTAGQQSAFEIAPGHGFAVTVLTNARHGFVLAEEVTAWATRTFLGITEPLIVRADEHSAGECHDGTNTRMP